VAAVPHPERVEKVRQEVMRLRELLTYMHTKLDSWERAYKRLFDHLPSEMINSLKEKDLQREAALTLIEEPKPLITAVLQAQYDSREMERAFEELYHIILTNDEDIE